jgi:hypothetical protein
LVTLGIKKISDKKQKKCWVCHGSGHSSGTSNAGYEGHVEVNSGHHDPHHHHDHHPHHNHHQHHAKCAHCDGSGYEG